MAEETFMITVSTDGLDSDVFSRGLTIHSTKKVMENVVKQVLRELLVSSFKSVSIRIRRESDAETIHRIELNNYKP